MCNRKKKWKYYIMYYDIMVLFFYYHFNKVIIKALKTFITGKVCPKIVFLNKCSYNIIITTLFLVK